MAREKGLEAVCRELDVEVVEEYSGQLLGYQSEVTGYGPLHWVVEEIIGRRGEEDAAAENRGVQVLEYLLSNGAVWNQCDREGLTAGCRARMGGLHKAYNCFIMAGVRAELLFGVMGRGKKAGDDEQNPSKVYLASSVRYADGNTLLLDESNLPVMMEWERDIMHKSVDALLPSGDADDEAELTVLNVGFGLGIIDSYFQAKKPTSHYIIEAHPAVIAHMKQQGWDAKQKVHIMEGPWQIYAEGLADDGIMFDAIYYDTYQESYEDLRQFAEITLALLKPRGRFSFFNGLGADRQTFYDVYNTLVPIDFGGMGLHVDYTAVQIPKMADDAWKGSAAEHGHKYWELKSDYMLPVITLASTL